MSLVKSFVKFISDAKPVSKVSDIETGRAAAEGVIRIGKDGSITSPVKGRPCIAFYYKAFHVVGSRTGQMMPRKLRIHEVYHPFELELEDGRIVATPKKSDDFTATDHKELSGHGYQGFRAVEELVAPGTRVRIYGVAKQGDEMWNLTFNKLELVESAPSAENGAPKKKKKKKSKSKAKKKS